MGIVINFLGKNFLEVREEYKINDYGKVRVRENDNIKVVFKLNSFMWC